MKRPAQSLSSFQYRPESPVPILARRMLLVIGDARQVQVVHPGFGDRGKQPIWILPCTAREQSIRFAARESERRIRHDAEQGEKSRMRLAEQRGQLMVEGQG